MSEYGSILQNKVYDVNIHIYNATKLFPKSEKFMLSADIRRSAQNMMRLILASIKKHHRKTSLTEADIELANLKLLMRMSYDLRFTSMKCYGDIAVALDEIGRILGGWIKTTTQ